jgi:hypothetical protein
MIFELVCTVGRSVFGCLSSLVRLFFLAEKRSMFYCSRGCCADQGLERAGAVHGLSKKIDAGNIKK